MASLGLTGFRRIYLLLNGTYQLEGSGTCGCSGCCCRGCSGCILESAGWNYRESTGFSSDSCCSWISTTATREPFVVASPASDTSRGGSGTKPESWPRSTWCFWPAPHDSRCRDSEISWKLLRVLEVGPSTTKTIKKCTQDATEKKKTGNSIFLRLKFDQFCVSSSSHFFRAYPRNLSTHIFVHFFFNNTLFLQEKNMHKFSFEFLLFLKANLHSFDFPGFWAHFIPKIIKKLSVQIFTNNLKLHFGSENHWFGLYYNVKLPIHFL